MLLQVKKDFIQIFDTETCTATKKEKERGMRLVQSKLMKSYRSHHKLNMPYGLSSAEIYLYSHL